MGADISRDLAADVLRAFRGENEFSVVFPDGSTVGAGFDESPGLAEAQRGAAFSREIDGGYEVLVPVLDTFDVPTPGEIERPVRTVVVRTEVSDGELQQGVTTAWAMLGALGVFLVVIAVIATDRLGRTIVRPVATLSDAARSLGSGDLDTRVEPAGPPEVAEVGEAFNFLAHRLVGLLNAERESVADLSHRLRTPLTAAPAPGGDAAGPRRGGGADRRHRAHGPGGGPDDRGGPPSGRGRRCNATADLAAVVRHRATFWKVLADEQGRPTRVDTTGGPMWVGIGADELGAVIDTLIENVFSHTSPGTGYRISVGPSRGTVQLVIEDDGPGFPDRAVVKRGTSAAGSTGLGLDIARRAATRTGGELVVTNRPEGGARVAVRFGVQTPAAVAAASGATGG